MDSLLNKALLNYQDLLKVVEQQAEVICISTPLPTIADGQNWGDIANARKSIMASQLQRTELTLEFNKQMRAYCSNNGHSYISLDKESLGDNGLVKSSLLNPDPKDHHYHKRTYSYLLASKMKNLI